MMVSAKKNPRQEFKKPSKSAQIRQLLAKIPTEKVDDMKEVRDIIRKAKINVDDHTIYQVRYDMKKKGLLGEKDPSSLVSVDDVLAVQAFAKKVGGINRLKVLIKKLEQFNEGIS